MYHQLLSDRLLAGSILPELAQAMRSQLGLAVSCEHTFQIEATSTADRLPGFEITEIPYMLANNVGFLLEQLDIARQKFGLIFLAKHLWLLRMPARQRIRAKFGHEQGFGIALMQGVKFG